MMLFIAAVSYGQKISSLQLDNKQSILNDKAFFYFPTGAKNVARQVDIMSADPNINQETRIILDIDKQRVVFFARELFVTSDDKLFETIVKEEAGNSKSKVLGNKDGLLSVLSTPAKYDTSQTAILINNLHVRTQDNSVFVIEAYINPEAFINRKEFQELSEKVFATLTKGNRLLNLKARTERFPIFNGKKQFTIALPQGYTVTKDKSYDFEVLELKKIKDIADTNWLSLTIYTGNYPSYFYKDYNLEEGQAEKVKGKFLDKNVEWLYFKTVDEPLYLKEQEIPCDNIENGLIVHIAMLANKPSAINELTELIEHMKLTEK